MSLKILAILVLVSSCTKPRVYEHIDMLNMNSPRSLKKGSYVMDSHIDKYMGNWKSSAYQLSISKEYRKEINGMLWDEGVGDLTIINGEEKINFTIITRSLSESTGGLIVNETDEFFRIVIDSSDNNILKLSKAFSERFYITTEGEKRKTYPPLPKEIILTRVY